MSRGEPRPMPLRHLQARIAGLRALWGEAFAHEQQHLLWHCAGLPSRTDDEIALKQRLEYCVLIARPTPTPERVA